MFKTLCILGSTGSIGTQSLDVARKLGFAVYAVTADTNVDIIEGQIREFKPKFAAMVNVQAAKKLAEKVADTDTVVLSGIEGVCECVKGEEVDVVINAIVGMAGLIPTLEAIEYNKTIALANKETLVAGGQLVMDKAKENGVDILPVDSEHSAIFQCLEGMNKKDELQSIILTASGGPFFGRTKADLEKVTLEQALNHPNWAMGAKITVDSATMMNKGLELIEAVWLFDVSPKDIQIVVHRESVVHSLIEYCDNSVIAQLGVPDMKIPIQYAVTYPQRFESDVKKLSLSQYGNLSFAEPDYDTFECINHCKNAIAKGGLYPCIVNGANERANELFREGKIKFLDIPMLVGKALNTLESKEVYTLQDVLDTDKKAREFVNSEYDKVIK